MANAIELITKYSTKAWDKVYRSKACSSVLEGEDQMLKFVGARTVKIAKVETSGLSDYHRANKPADGVFGGDGHETDFVNGQGYGYQQGDVNVTWEEFHLSQDRGVQLRIALFDDEESAGIAVGAATTETMRVRVIPELDAYRFSKIVDYALPANILTSQALAPSTTAGQSAAGDPVFEMNRAFKALADAEVPEEDQIIFVSTEFMAALRNSATIVKTLRQSEYSGKVSFTIENYEGRDLVVVPPSRFKTLFKALQGGYGWGIGSRDINMIVCAKSAIIPVVKYEKQRVFGPEVVQDFDGYKVNVRVYHDLFVMDNKRPAIYVWLKSGDAAVAATSTRGLVMTGNPTVDGTKISLSGVAIDPLFGKGGVLVRDIVGAPAGKAIGAALGDTDVIVFANKGLGLYEADGVSGKTYEIYGVDNGIITALSGKSATIA